MPDSQQMDVTADDLGSAQPGGAGAACLTLAFQADRPLAPPRSFSLDGIDAALFSRGREATAERVEKDAETQLRVELPDRFLSSSHASLQKVFGRWLLADDGSRNGTFVDGARIDRCELADGALIEIGHSFLVFRAHAGATPATSAWAALAGAGATGAASTGSAVAGLAGDGVDGSLQPAFAAQLRALDRAARASLPIMLRGESGTGKEVLARKVHALSGRPGAFQPINCAALAPALVESELFGYRKGAFSGALEDRPGLVRSADQGTLFLDEIGDLPLPAQGALLRVLQESEVLPVGATKAVPVDFRLVVATHRDLEAMAAAGEFRHDLLARLGGFTVDLPPLRERREDLGMLVAALLRRHAPAHAAALRFTPAAARALFLHRWPLNVRELEKALELAAALAPDGVVDLPHLPLPVRAAAVAKPQVAAPELPPEEEQRRQELLALLREHRGNVSAVARVLGKARVQVQRWMRRYRILPATFR